MQQLDEIEGGFRREQAFQAEQRGFGVNAGGGGFGGAGFVGRELDADRFRRERDDALRRRINGPPEPMNAELFREGLADEGFRNEDWAVQVLQQPDFMFERFRGEGLSRRDAAQRVEVMHDEARRQLPNTFRNFRSRHFESNEAMA